MFRTHQRGLLVHSVDVLRESGGDSRAVSHGYVQRDPARGRAGFVLAQFVAVAVATRLLRWLVPAPSTARLHVGAGIDGQEARGREKR